MKFRTIQKTVLTACLCACMTAFGGCSNGANEPYDMPSGDSMTESSDDSSSESSEISTDDMPDESSKPQESSVEEYPEIVLDHEYLKTVDGDILDVEIYLHMDEEARRAEFEMKYPELIGKDVYYYYWPRYLWNYSERISQELLNDYNIAIEELRSTILISGHWRGNFDKEMLSLLLDDPRIREIIYYPNGSILDHLT